MIGGMSLYFIANNFHFSLEMIGALVFFVMAWLSVDAYLISKHHSTAMRIAGLAILGLWQLIHVFGMGGDIVNFSGFLIYLVGLSLILASFITRPTLAAVSVVILLPSFTGTVPYLEMIAALLLGAIAFSAYRQSESEFNRTLQPLYLGFAFLGIAALFQAVPGSQSSDNILWYVAHVFLLIGLATLIYWVWQYLKLRVRESLVLIFISTTLFMATIVTLAFSTILISRVEQETRGSLLTDAKVFDFAVRGLSAEAEAKAKLAAADEKLSAALYQDNLAAEESILSGYLREERLGFILLTDINGTVSMRAHSPGERGDSIASERAVTESLLGNAFTTIEFSPAEKFSIRAGAPVYRSGKVIGAVIAGFPLDNTMVDKIKKITGLDATLYRGDTSIAATALAEDGRSRLTGSMLSDEGVKESVLSKGGSATARVVIKDSAFLASYVPIINGDGKIVGMFSAAKPQSEILDIADATNRLTLATVMIIMLILIVPIYFIIKRLNDEQVSA